VKVRGEFKHKWELAKFPGDTQELKITIDEGDREVSDIVMSTIRSEMLNHRALIRVSRYPQEFHGLGRRP